MNGDEIHDAEIVQEPLPDPVDARNAESSADIGMALQIYQKVGMVPFEKTVIDELAKWQGVASAPELEEMYDILPTGELYCLAPSSRVLRSDLTWVPIGDLRVGDELIGVDEKVPFRQRRKMKPAAVVAVASRKTTRCRIIFENGKEVVCTPDHPWLSSSVGQNLRGWRMTRQLRPGYEIAYLGEPWATNTTRLGGYLAGLYDGEGCLVRQRGDRPGGAGGERGTFCVSLSQNPGVVLDEARRALQELGFPVSLNKPNGGSNSKSPCLAFNVRGVYNVLRLLGELRPLRLLDKARPVWNGKTPENRGSANNLVVERIETLTAGEVIDIETTAGTFYAEGLVSHNCPQIFYRRILNKAFGQGGWAMVPMDPRPVVTGDQGKGTSQLVQVWALIAHGRYVSEAMGGAEYNPANSRMLWSDACETVKSNAVMRLCKDLGLAGDCWDRRYIAQWKKKHGIAVWVAKKYQDKGQWRVKGDLQWRRRDADPLRNELREVREGETSIAVNEHPFGVFNIVEKEGKAETKQKPEPKPPVQSPDKAVAAQSGSLPTSQPADPERQPLLAIAQSAGHGGYFTARGVTIVEVKRTARKDKDGNPKKNGAGEISYTYGGKTDNGEWITFFSTSDANALNKAAQEKRTVDLQCKAALKGEKWFINLEEIVGEA